MSEIAAELKRSPLFKTVELYDLQDLTALMKVRTYDTYDIIFNEGDAGESMIFIRHGRIRIFTMDSNGNEIDFRFFGAGELFGEFAFLDGKPRSMSASAEGPVEVLELTRDAFMQFLKEHPAVGYKMMLRMAERVRYTTQFLQKMFESVQLLSQNDYDNALRQMIAETGSDEIQPLITAFVEMVRSVQQREPGTPPTTTSAPDDLFREYPTTNNA